MKTPLWLRNKIARWLRLPDPVIHLELVREVEDAGRELARLKLEFDKERSRAQWLTRNLVELRVCQSKLSRTGWEVMCFIPEEVINTLQAEVKGQPRFVTGRYERLVQRVTLELVRLAIEGIVRIDSQGKVCALVFEPLNPYEKPRAPQYVQAFFDKDGEFKMSEKCWDTRTEEQRVRAAAGCGG